MERTVRDTCFLCLSLFLTRHVTNQQRGALPEPVRGEMLTAATIQLVNTYEWVVDPFTEKTTRQACAELSDYIVRLANEPSLGLHHVTTHIHHKAVPRMSAARDSLQGVTREAAMAKMFATEGAQAVIDAAVQLWGGRGVQSGETVERLYREIRALRIYEGATEVQQLIIGRELLRGLGT